MNIKDFAVTGEHFELVYDKSMDLWRTVPQPENLAPYYDSDRYISHTDSNKSLVDKLYQQAKNISIRRKLRLIGKCANGKKTLLDVGAGTGDFLLEARQRGWKVEGVEPSEVARQRAEAKGLVLLPDLNKSIGEKFQIITLWHVLEHMRDIETQIKLLASLLESEGTLIVAVPNFKSYDARIYGGFWAAYDVPRHLWHFSRDAITTLFARHKIKLIDTKPMIFDAFYVSLLSEEYKTGKNSFIKAMFNGLVSNISAWKSKEYSSIIYILQKE
jgi:2-polyprenyl-3-methyl-5-hydroxy-6-metoxy-1,4-benzoquinol methylase